jgi:ATP-dependent DNA helicase PIF1
MFKVLTLILLIVQINAIAGLSRMLSRSLRSQNLRLFSGSSRVTYFTKYGSTAHHLQPFSRLSTRSYHWGRSPTRSSSTNLAEWCYGEYTDGSLDNMTTSSINTDNRDINFDKTNMNNASMRPSPIDVPGESTNVLKSGSTESEMEEVEEYIGVEDGINNLREVLKSWRKQYAEEAQVPVYTVFTNKVLEGICESLPTTESELLYISGVGEKTKDKIAGKVLPLVKCVLEGIPFPSTAAVSMLSPLAPPMAKTVGKEGNVEENKEAFKIRRNARMAAILASLESQTIITHDDLNEEQQYASERVISNKNAFITGSAGTGKSFLLRYLVQELQNRFGNNAVAVTASTGIAAVNLGGQTLHSFAGIGLANGLGDNQKVINKIRKNMKAVKRWQDARVLIIDEISMIDKAVFELIDLVARDIRRNDAPFGGLQMVLVGDFLQLPPIPNRFSKQREFCFESSVWNDLGLGVVDEHGRIYAHEEGVITLNQVVRQSDNDFISLLNDIRIGKVSTDQLAMLNGCVVDRKARPNDGIVPTKLYSINRDVDKENMDRLNELHGEIVEINASDIWLEKPVGGATQKNAMVDNMDRAIASTVSLKVGAQVMLLRNRKTEGENSGYSGLVNGSRGVITGFVQSSSSSFGASLVPRVCFDNGQEVIIGPVEYVVYGPGGEGQLVRQQVPLKLAWAVTIHKSQGTTLSRAELMLTNTFDYGQAYVALSRVTSVDGLWLTHPISKNSIKANPAVLHYFNM